MATALDLINGAMRLCGILAEGEQPSSESAQDALTAFNQLLDSWANVGCILHHTQSQAIPWASGVTSKAVGPTGEFVGVRPISALPSTYYTAGGIDYDLTVISERDYSSISMKDMEGSNPDFLYLDMTYPNATLTLYPIPSEAIVLHLSSVVELTQIAALSDTVIVPPGYLRAFRYNLALEIAGEFGVEASPIVQRLAVQSMRMIKRTNKTNSKSGTMRLPSVLLKTHTSILEG